MELKEYSKLANLLTKYGNLTDIDEKELRKAISVVLDNIEYDLKENYEFEAKHNFIGRV